MVTLYKPFRRILVYISVRFFTSPSHHIRDKEPWFEINRYRKSFLLRSSFAPCSLFLRFKAGKTTSDSILLV